MKKQRTNAVLPPSAAEPMVRRLPQACETFRVRRHPLRTEDVDVGWLRRYAHFCGVRLPRELGAQ